jgi:hypothetical protein
LGKSTDFFVHVLVHSSSVAVNIIISVRNPDPEARNPKGEIKCELRNAKRYCVFFNEAASLNCIEKKQIIAKTWPGSMYFFRGQKYTDEMVTRWYFLSILIETK